MVKSSLKLKIIQGLIMGVIYSCIMTLFYWLLDEKFSIGQFIFHVVFFGGIMGIVFPLITEKFTNKKALNKIIVDLSQDEKLELESGATLKSRLHSDWGKLVLTDKRLVFKPYQSFKDKVVEIPFNEIIKVEKQKTLKFVNNVFKVQTNQEEYKFIVYEKERDTWVSLLNKS